MTRYAVPIVLAIWAVSAALGCDWTWFWLGPLLIALGVQMEATIRTYR